MLDALFDVPAWVSNERLDILGANRLGVALYRDVRTQPDRAANVARFLFLDDRSREFYVEWDRHARNTVAVLRRAAARDPYHEKLCDLVGELNTRNNEFRVLWGQHDVRPQYSGQLALRHSAVGRLDLAFEAMDLTADRGLTMYVATAEPNSASAERLRLLGGLTVADRNKPQV